MLVGVQSDEYIKKNCWEMTAPMDFRKRIGKPIRIPASGNMRQDFTFSQQQPSSIIDLAKNIVSITPKNNRPANANIVSFVAESLMKQEEPVKEEPEFAINYNPTYSRVSVAEDELVPFMTEREFQAYTRSQNTAMMFETYLPPTGERIYAGSVGGMVGGMSSPMIPPDRPLPVPSRTPNSIGHFSRSAQASLRSVASETVSAPTTSGTIYTTGRGGMRGGMTNIPDM
jgi:hypothetical protein